MSRPPTAPPIVIPNCIQVILRFSHAEGDWHNVIHGNLTAVGPINPGLAETLFSAFKANTGVSAWMAQVDTNASFSGVTVKDLRAGNNPTYLSTGLPLPGTGVGNALSLNAALVVTHRTAQSGRQFRGRSYLAGLVQTNLETMKRWSEAAGTLGIGFMNGLQSVMTANSIPMVIAHKRLMAGTDSAGRPLDERPANVVPITSFEIASARVDSQRKRLGR
jgi:hypothetical protein